MFFNQWDRKSSCENEQQSDWKEERVVKKKILLKQCITGKLSLLYTLGTKEKTSGFNTMI